MTKQHNHLMASGSQSAGRPRVAFARVFAAVLAAVPFFANAFNWSDYAAGTIVTVTGNATATDADMATINAYSKLCFASGTRITFDVSGDVSLTCPVAATGTIVKCGSGSLALATSSVNGSINTYRYVDFEVEEGMLKLPQDNFTLTDIWVRKVTVGENGAFMTVIDHNTNIEGGLWGSGIVTNTSTAGNSQLRVMNVSTTPCVFSGRILGKGIRWYSGGNVHLTGTNSNFTGTFQIWNGNGDVARRGTTGLVKIGNPGEVSSVGCTTGNLASREMGARFLYLGEGETTSRGYAYYNNHTSSSGAHYWDAGAHGGITFTGTWSHGSDHPERVVLMGSNTAPCVIAGSWTGCTDTRPTYVIKRGSGTWRFAHNSNRTLSGTIAVEDGTLEFETIAEVGENCSLGRATCLQSSYTAAAYDASKNVDYAYLLGTTSSTGTMAYVGSSGGASRTRPFAVAGRGCLSNAGTGRLSLANAFAATAAGGTFVLDAPAGSTNSFSMVRDGDHGGVLSLEKTGAGVWSLDGTNTFSGSLAVKEGTLLVRNVPYSWFRFTVMETLGGKKYREGTDTGADRNLEIQEFALYSADGVRRNVNMKFLMSYTTGSTAAASAANYANIQTNEASWTFPKTYLYYTNRDGDKMFDEVSTGTGCCIFYNSDWIRLSSSASWVPLLLRVDPEGPAITSFDLMNVNGAGSVRSPLAFKMEASRDGLAWTQVYCETNHTAPATGRWYSDHNEAFVAGAVRPGKGFSVSNEICAADEMLPNVSGVSVAPDAVLEAKGPVVLKTLTADASGAGNGTVKGFTFAAAGVLDVKGLAAVPGRLDIPFTFDDCAGIENISKWTLTVDGAPALKCRARASETGISLFSTGTLIYIK